MERKTATAIILGTILLVVLAFVFLGRAEAPTDTESTQTTPASENVVTTDTDIPDNLIIEDVLVGTGSAVKSGDSIVIHYAGTLTDGTLFDNSYDRGEPFETQIGVGNVIRGWDLGVPGMKVGGRRRLTIPAELGYGEQGTQNIPPGSTLIFELELLEIK
jgi:FKBP-type peptidyl-prolyl cis-trans isomerase FkpA